MNAPRSMRIRPLSALAIIAGRAEAADIPVTQRFHDVAERYAAALQNAAKVAVSDDELPLLATMPHLATLHVATLGGMRAALVSRIAEVDAAPEARRHWIWAVRNASHISLLALLERLEWIAAGPHS